MALRILALLLLLLLAPAAGAVPSVADRSPLRPGLWWDPQHAGSGFDIHVSGPTVFALWYTYRADGSPIWYSAQGRFDADGRLQADWREHAWQDGAERARVVGELRLERLNPDRLVADWRIHGRDGRWHLQPLPVAADSSEIDHSGAWYEPARSGYGLTVAEQGRWRVLAFYAYDEAGQPTWLLGHNGGSGDRVQLERFSGACPGCAATPVAAAPAGRATPAFAAETVLALDLELEPAAGVAAAFAVPGQPLQMLSAPVSARAADRQLARFGDEAALLDSLRAMVLEGAPHPPYGPSPIGSPAPPAVPVVSTTNLVVAGVDEADSLKSDGRFVYSFDRGSHGAVLPLLRIAELTGPGLDLQLHPPLAIGGDGDRPPSRRGLYLHGDRLLTLGWRTPTYFGGPTLTVPPPDWWSNGRFDVELFDRSVPGQPRSLWRAEIDGYLVASRRIGDQLYLIHRSAHLPAGLRRSADAEAVAHNRALLAEVPLAALLPSIRVDGGEAQPLLVADKVLLPPVGARRPMPEFACVTRIDLRDPQQRETLAVVGGVEHVYVAADALYIATGRYQPILEAGVLRWPGTATTEIHRVVLGEEALRVDGSGSVEGVVGRDSERSPFRFSDHDGRLRLLTVGDFGALGRNRLSVLEPSAVAPGVLKRVGELPNPARPQPIGKPFEDLYGTRFVGDRLYAVTFLNVDPLYVIDLADPADPKITGAVELPGFSDYLHPLAGDLLLGVGLDASPASGAGDGRFAWFQGLQVVLFDVADPTAPTVLDRLLLGQRGSGSAALRSHHGFASLELADGRFRFAFPARIHGERWPGTAGSGSTIAPWRESGLFAFDVLGQGAAARLQPLAPMIVAAPPASGFDDSAHDARALLTADGVLQVANGRFWTAGWETLATPVGPR